MLISALMIGFCSAYASAATPVWLLRAKAGIAAALMAANIVFEPISAAYTQTLADVIDPLNMVSSVYDTSWEDYINQSVIAVRPDVVTIDGVEYSEIWLGPNAANSLRASGWDFTTAYNLLSNQNTPVTYAEGVGYMAGIPVYSVNGDIRSPYYNAPLSPTQGNSVTYSVGDLIVTFNTLRQDSTRTRVTAAYTDTGIPPAAFTMLTVKNNPDFSTDQQVFIKYNNAAYRLCSTITNGRIDGPALTLVSSPFDFDYTSGIIDADPVDDGLLLRVPSEYTDSQGHTEYNYNIHDLINIYPQVDDTNGHELIFDPSLNPDFDVDLDMGNALGDIITAIILAKLADLLGDDAEIVYAPMPEKEDPAPVIPDPDTPDPDVPIGDQDPIWLDDLMRWIKNAIDNLGHTISDAIDMIHEDIQEIIEQLSELPDKILEEIELGPAKLIDKALDILKSLLMPILLPIRAMMNLWHYVVEWLTSISIPFTWIFGIMAATSYNMVLPIYALLAGGICIAIYKVFGR